MFIVIWYCLFIDVLIYNYTNVFIFFYKIYIWFSIILCCLAVCGWLSLFRCMRESPKKAVCPRIHPNHRPFDAIIIWKGKGDTAGIALSMPSRAAVLYCLTWCCCVRNFHKLFSVFPYYDFVKFFFQLITYFYFEKNMPLHEFIVTLSSNSEKREKSLIVLSWQRSWSTEAYFFCYTFSFNWQCFIYKVFESKMRRTFTVFPVTTPLKFAKY